MTRITDPLLIQSRAMLERWLRYYEGKGSSANLYADTAALAALLPEPARFIPTPEEVRRMENDGSE